MSEITPNNVFSRLVIRTDCKSLVADCRNEKEAIHEAIEIKYFTAGSSTLLIGEKTVKVSAGDLVVINPFEFHATIANGQTEGQYHILMVPLEFFFNETADDLNLRQLLLEKRFRFRTNRRADDDARRCVLRIVEESRGKKPFHRMMIRSLLLELFGLLLREGVGEQGESVMEQEALRTYQSIEPALRFIRDAYGKRISLDHLAKLCRLSKHHFCRLFKSALGKPTMEYLREYRLKVAHSMLEKPDKSLAQIATECGFSDENYFCRCYRRHYGVSPGKTRELMKKERATDPEGRT